jgi:protein-disulfide isomerase
MKTGITLAMLAGLTFLSAHAGLAQSSADVQALRKEVEALKDGQTAIRKLLQEVKDLLLRGAQATRPPEPQNVVLSVDGAPFMGSPDAKVTLLEFSDYQCPFYGRHASQTLPQFVAEYVKTDKVKYVLRDFPLEAIHPQAFKAAEAARCAGEQGKYWEMHDRIFANQKAMAPTDLVNHAQALGGDLAKFQQCLDSGKYAAKIRADLAVGEKAGVTGTPTFFPGLSEPKGSPVKAVRKIVGSQPYGAFKEAVDSLLAAQKP